MAGRSFCMIYALIGIPLGLVMFQSIGERLNTIVGWALRNAKRCFKARNQEVSSLILMSNYMSNSGVAPLEQRATCLLARPSEAHNSITTFLLQSNVNR